MLSLKNILFIFIFFLASCAGTQTNQIRKISSITECSDYLRKVLPVLARAKGIEFEGSMPNNIDYEYVANFISKKIKSIYPDSTPAVTETLNENGQVFKIEFDLEGQTHIYTIENDVSLAFGLDDYAKPIEISSPILTSYKEIENHLTIIESLEKIGIRARPDEGAIHIHHDLDDDFNFEDLYFVYNSLSKMQDSFRDVFHYNDRRGFNKSGHLQYIAENLRRLIDSGTNLEENLDVIQLVDDKGYIRTSHKYGTLEFRFFNSTTSKDEQLLFIDFINKFMKERNNPELIAHFNKNKKVSILDVSQIIGADLHLNPHLLSNIKDRNEYYEQLAQLQEGLIPFPRFKNITPKVHSVTELMTHINSIKSDVELSYFIINKVTNISSSTYDQWVDLISNLNTKELSLSALLHHIPYQSFTLLQVINIGQIILKDGHGEIFSKVFNLVSKNIQEPELSQVLEDIFIPRLKSMSAEQDFSLSYLIEALIHSDLEDTIIDKYVTILKNHFRIGKLSSVQIKIHKLFAAHPIHFNTLSTILNESKDYNSFLHMPIYREILKNSSTNPEYMDDIFKGVYSKLDEQQQIKFFYFFIEFLKLDNLQEITSLIPFFEKSFKHLKSFDKLQDLVSILSSQAHEIFKGPRRNQLLLSNVYNKLISLPQASTKIALVQKVIRLTSLVKHLEYPPYIDIIIKEMNLGHSDELTVDFIHMLSSTHKMNPMSDVNINTYLNFVWDQLDKKDYYQLQPYAVKTLLDKLNELDRNVIKTMNNRQMRRAHHKIYKHIRNRVEMIQYGR